MIERALFLNEPARLAKPWTRLDVVKLWTARFNVLLPLFRRDAEGFNRAVVNTLEVHKKFYGTKRESQHEYGFLAMEQAAFCAVAHDAGLPIEVESEYLPSSLIQRAPLRESAAKPAAKRPAKPLRGRRR